MEEVIELKDPIYLDCSCGSEVLRIQYDEEFETYDIAIYTVNLGNMTWKNKFRFIWQLLKGEPYGDQIVVHKNEMQKIKSYINSP